MPITNDSLVLVPQIWQAVVMYFAFFDLPKIRDTEFKSIPLWRDSKHICALADTERHFGHIINTGQWHAYDATHLNSATTGFNYLGAFEDLTAAKHAVESAVKLRAYERASLPARYA